MKIETVEQLKAAIEEWHKTIHPVRPDGFQITPGIQQEASRRGLTLESMEDWKLMLNDFLAGAETVTKALMEQHDKAIRHISNATDGAKEILSRCV